MAQSVTVEAWVLVDSEGEYSAGTSAEQCQEHYENDIRALSDSGGFRLVKIALTVPLPTTVELAGTVADDGSASMVVSPVL